MEKIKVAIYHYITLNCDSDVFLLLPKWGSDPAGVLSVINTVIHRTKSQVQLWARAACDDLIVIEPHNGG